MTTTEDNLTPLGKPKGDARMKKVPNPVTDLGFCHLCGVLVKKFTGWGLRTVSGASRLFCEGCK